MEKQFRVLGYWEMVSACKIMASEIKERFGVPDCIVYISRGGMVPARLLSDELDVRTLASVNAHRYEDVGKAGALNIDMLSVERLKDLGMKDGSTILLVDDLSDSGETFIGIRSAMAKTLPNVRIITAAPISKSHTAYKPDIDTPIKVPGTTWIIFPYAREEVRRSFVKSGDKEGLRVLQRADEGFYPE